MNQVKVFLVFSSLLLSLSISIFLCALYKMVIFKIYRFQMLLAIWVRKNSMFCLDHLEGAL